MISLNNLMSMFACHPWAIRAEKLQAMIDMSTSNIVAAIERPKANQSTVQSVAYLPIRGIIDQHDSWFLQAFGGTSTEEFGMMFDKFIADPSIGAIVFDIDSPGGSVYGVQELSDKIYNARGKKPIIAISNSLMASAAYWIGSAADEIYITPSGEAGSIGVIAVHADYSQFEKGMGVKTTIIKAGKYKGEGNPHEPLSDSAHADIQKRIDEYYDAFVGAVARNRRVSRSKVLSDFGQGRVFGANEAKMSGMADGVMTAEHLFRTVQSRKQLPKKAAEEFNRNKMAVEMARVK